MKQRERMTVKQFCEEYGISRRTWEDWRVRGVTPPYRKLHNGKLIMFRDDVEAWFELLPGGGMDLRALKRAKSRGLVEAA